MSAAQPRPAGPTRPPLPGTAAFTVPAPPACGGHRHRSCCGQSAAKRRPQLRPRAGALAPPIVKGPAGGSGYKASAGVHAAQPLPISSRDTAGSPRAVQSAAEPGPGAAPGDGLPAWARLGKLHPLSLHDSALGVVREPHQRLPRSLPEGWAEVRKESAGEIVMLIIIPVANPVMPLTC